MAEGDNIIDWDDIIGKTDAFDVLSANIKKIEKELLDMVKATDKAFDSLAPNDSAGLDKIEKQVIANEKAQKKAIQTEKSANKVRKATIDLTNEQLIQLQKEKLVQQERIARAKQQAIISTEEKNNIASLRAQLSLATLDWKKLTAEEAKNTKEGKKLVANKKSLTKQLKKLEEATDDHRRSVGKYSKSLSGLGKVAARVFIGRSIVDGLRSISNGVLNLIKDNRDANESINSLGNAFDSTSSALKNAAVSILTFFAPALTAMANGIKVVTEFLFGVNFQANEFSATSDALAEKTSSLNKEFVKESSELQIVFERLSKTNEGSKERKDLIDKINTVYGKYLPNLLTEKSTLTEIAAAQKIANEQLSASFLLKVQEATLLDVVTNKVNKNISSYESFNEILLANKATVKGNVAQFNQLAEGLTDANSDISNVISSITGGRFDFDKFNAVVAKSSPKLAVFLKSIKALDKPLRETLIGVLKRAGTSSKAYNVVIDSTNEIIGDISESLVTYDHTLEESTSSLDKNTKAQKDNTDSRLAAIEALQRTLEKAEVDNIQDKNTRLIALEELRFKEEQRVRKEGFVELKALTVKQGGDLVELEGINDDLIEEQEIAHQQNLLDIAAGFNDEKKALIAKISADAQQEQAAANKESQQLISDAQKDILAEEKEISRRRASRKKQEAKDRKESAKNQEENSKKILQNILDTQQKIGAIINDLFKKQVDLSAKSVNEQEENLSRARDRAADGLSANLVFEEKELSKRQAENRRRQEEAKNIAKVVALFNLTSAAAASGDKNAVLTAITQFGVLTGFEALIGFEQGTEHVGKSLGKGAAIRSGVDGYLGITGQGEQFRFDGRERIVSGDDNALLGGMSAEDLVPNALLGSAMSDYFDRPSILSSNPYKEQQDSFRKAVSTQKADNRVLDELKGIKAQLSSQPNYSAQIVEVQKDMHEFVLSENRKNMKKITRQILRG